MAQKIWLGGLVVGPIRTNCYFLGNQDTGETIIVDPGDEGENIIKLLNQRKAKPAAVLLTHGHYDHILAVNDLKKEYPGIPVLISELERPMVEDQSLNSGIGGYDYTFTPTRYVKDLEMIQYAGISLQVISTPGHTAGSCCYYDAEDKILFSGDTIFCESYGRCDLPTGSMTDMRKSLEKVLCSLPEDVQVFPGHGPKTSIGQEKMIEGF